MAVPGPSRKHVVGIGELRDRMRLTAAYFHDVYLAVLTGTIVDGKEPTVRRPMWAARKSL